MVTSDFVKLAGALLVLVFFSDTILAQPAADFVSQKQKRAERKMDEFETLDTNADGLVSFAEFTHAKRLVFRHSFNEMDDNKDGFVTRNEHRAEAVFNEMDANRDQHVTFYEFQELKIARHKVRFKKKDKNKDGYLTRPEFESGRVKSKKKKRPMGTPYPKSPLGEHRF